MLPTDATPSLTSRHGVRSWRAIAGVLAALLLAGCADTRYYWQSVSGHLQLLQAARPVAQWLDDAQVPAQLKDRLRLSQRMRDFAVHELALPDNASYRRYADLHRSAAVWNVVAAPPYSLDLHAWCFPVLGCVTYRGYFEQAQAGHEAEALRAQGLEVSVYGVPAYSTLGWLNWFGGDPLLNTFIDDPQGQLARLLFHELAHQVVYARDDTAFNESFATAVGRLGSARWLATHAPAGAAAAQAVQDQREREFRQLVSTTRARLQRLYRNDEGLDRAALQQHKQSVMQEFRARYATLRSGWGGFAGYDAWVAGANNASLGAQAAYDELVPQFEALFARSGQDWPSFYDAVRRLAALPPDARRAALARAAEPP